MIAIVLWTCLVSNPTECRDHKIPLLSGISATQCMMRAPPHVAKWSEDHPQWHIVRWQCQAANQDDI